MNKKFVAILMAMIMMLSVAAGCTAPSTTPNPEPPKPADQSGQDSPSETSAPAGVTSTKDTIIFANDSAVSTLAPYADVQLYRGRITNNIYESLMVQYEDGRIEPRLATEWEWTDDTHLTIKLREGVVFHNGNPFTADDVLYTLSYAKESAVTAYFSSLDIDNCQKVNDYTVTIALFEPNGLFESYLANPVLTAILDQETVASNPDSLATQPNGTGPYKLKSFVSGDTTTLELFDSYWGEPGIIKNLIFRTITETTQAVIELQTGGVDFIFNLPITSQADVEANASYKVYSMPSFLINGLYFNCTEGKLLTNLDLRKAIAYAIDYDSIVKAAYNGKGSVAASFTSRAAIGFSHLSDDANWWSFDQDKAREHLAAAGYAEGVTIKVVHDDNPGRSATYEIIANQLAQVGITLEATTGDFMTALNFALDTGNDWDIFLLGNSESSVLLQADRLRRASAPFVAYTSDELQGILDVMYTSTDANVQNQQIALLGEYFDANVPFVPIHEDRVLMASAANLQGVEDAMYMSSTLWCSKMYFN